MLADGLSNVRTGPHDRSRVIAHHDALLRCAAFRDGHAPDLVLRFGATPTSKVLDELLDALDVPQLLVDDGGGWDAPAAADPRCRPTRSAFAEALAEAAW